MQLWPPLCARFTCFHLWYAIAYVVVPTITAKTPWIWWSEWERRRVFYYLLMLHLLIHSFRESWTLISGLFFWNQTNWCICCCRRDSNENLFNWMLCTVHTSLGGCRGGQIFDYRRSVKNVMGKMLLKKIRFAPGYMWGEAYHKVHECCFPLLLSWKVFLAGHVVLVVVFIAAGKEGEIQYMRSLKNRNAFECCCQSRKVLLKQYILKTSKEG